MLGCENDGVTTTKPGHHTTGNESVIWSDESSFMLFPASGRVYAWRTSKEACNSECLVPAVKHRGGSVMVRAAASWYSVLLVPLLPLMAELLQGSTWTGWVIRCIHDPDDAVLFKTTMLSFTQLELFSHGLKISKVRCRGHKSPPYWTLP
jgi:hypothetical protein